MKSQSASRLKVHASHAIQTRVWEYKNKRVQECAKSGSVGVGMRASAGTHIYTV
jgi:hypothetical protein